MAGATDTSKIASFKGNTTIQPIKKQLAFDLKKLDIRLDNLEGMALGSRLPDGSQTLLLVSDNTNYDPFELHISAINAVSIVMGVIRLE